MKSNLHTHSTFCDGACSCEKMILAAIEKGFSSIGMSSHGYTDFDLRYCMKDVDGYIKEVSGLKEKYKKDIQVYLGVEEDAFCLVDRERYDYIIGSSHYYLVNGEYYPIDSSPEHFDRCLAAFDHDALRMAEEYFTKFCAYIKTRKPDVVGHFDLITKYDEMGDSLFLRNADYNRIAERYAEKVAQSGCLVEVNTGAIARGYRRDPYPAQNLLHILKKYDCGLILSSDSHSTSTLDFGFDEARATLKDIGFKHIYNLFDGGFVKEKL